MGAKRDLPPPPVPGCRPGECAAHFDGVPTSRLVEEVQRLWAQHGDDELHEAASKRGEYTVSTFLVALHERADRSVFDAAATLIRSQDPVERLQGLAILRELGPWGGRPVFADTWELLEGLLEKESDGHIVKWSITCLGWTWKKRAFATLLRFSGHRDPCVRVAVADCLVGCAPKRNDRRLREALLTLCDDEDPDVRWAALYEVREWIRVLSVPMREMLARRLADPVPEVRELAGDAMRKDARRARARRRARKKARIAKPGR